MTKRLYYEDSYLAQFEGLVQRCESIEDGYAIVLNQSAFYPGGGGQPHDIGLLGGLDVIEVYEVDDIIYHKVDKPLEVGITVVGDVFIEKRMDYMAQHSGEHILSGILHAWFGYGNVGFHLSESYMTADFDGELTKQQLDLLELKANDAVMSNVPITAKVYTVGEETPAYRSKLTFDETVRLVEIEGFDTCACCGTHLKTSGEIGMIKIIGYEKHRGGCRLTVLCGRRAVYDYQSRFDELGEVSTILSAKVGKISETVERLHLESKNLQYQLNEVKRKLFVEEVKHYPTDRPLCIIREDLGAADLKMFTEILATHTGETVFVVAMDKGNFRYMVMSNEADVRSFAKVLNQQFEGKGGGKANLCQGSGKGKADAIETCFYAHFKSWVREIETYTPCNEQEKKDQQVFVDYINHFGNTLLRENEVAHVTSSAWIVNKDRSKVLLAHHNIYNAWAWTGGHNDGANDLLGVAIKEAQEETGVVNFTPLSTAIFSVDVLPVAGHIKKGKYVAPHLHLSVAYLLEADDKEAVSIKADENSGVKWIPVQEVMAYTANEPAMQVLYKKFMDKVQKED